MTNIETVLKRMEIGSHLSADERLAIIAHIGRMEKSLRDIESWARAYPLTVFPKPDKKRAAEVLSINGMSLDAISADAMRHVLEGIINIVRDGLGENDGTG